MSIMARFPLRLSQLLLIALFLTLGGYATLTTPLSDGPDEVSHFQLSRFIAQHQRLPVDDAERLQAGYKADLPPLFHALVGILGNPLDLESPPFVKITHNNPRLQRVVGLENVTAWRALTTLDPLQGEVLLWYLGRWVSLLAGLGGAIATYFISKKLLPPTTDPTRRALATMAAALLAFSPTYLFLSSVINYESLLGLLMGGYFLLLLHTLDQPDRAMPYLGLGLLLGLANLTKYTPLPVIPLIPLLIIWLARCHGWSWPTALQRITLFSLGLLLTIGSWVLYILLYFNQIATLGWLNGLLAPFLLGDGSGHTSRQIANLVSGGEMGITGRTPAGDSLFDWLWYFFQSSWGGPPVAWLFVPLWLLALLGLLIGLPKLRSLAPRLRLTPWPRPHLLPLTMLMLHFALLLFLPFLRFLFSGKASTGMGQHILFPAGPLLMPLLLVGCRVLLRPRPLLGILTILTMLVTAQSSYEIVQRVEPPLPVYAAPYNEATPSPLVDFGPLHLLHAEHAATATHLTLTLIWQATTLPEQDYRIALTLHHAPTDQQTEWRGQPLNGRYPTRAWLPTDRLRDTISLPLNGMPAGAYQLQLRLLDQQLQPVSEAVLSRTLRLNPTPEFAQHVTLADEPLGYTPPQSQRQHAAEVPEFRERAAIALTIADATAQTDLIDPDGQPHAPLNATMPLRVFTAQPTWAEGPYRLRVQRDKQTTETEPLLYFRPEERSFQPLDGATPVQANFAHQLLLRGYDLPSRQIDPGEALAVTLYWQALREIGADLLVFNHLVDAEQRQWAGRDRQPREVYSTMLWAKNEVVIDPFALPVAPTTPPGIYQLLVGVYLPVGGAPVSLPLVQEGHMSDITHVNLGPIKIGQTTSDFIQSHAQPQINLNQPLGANHQLTLLGYDMALLEESATLNLTLYWQVEELLSRDYTTFLHLRTPEGETIAQHDQPPRNGEYPTSLWSPGEIIADTISLPLPATLPPADHHLAIGLYHLHTGQRLPVPDNAANEISLPLNLPAP